MAGVVIAQTGSGTRERFNDFVARHEVAWELAFAALAIVFVGLAFLPITPDQEDLVNGVEWAITAAFALEFVSRLWASRSRRAYLRGHWIDLISLVPPARWLRPFRLLRLLRLVRMFAGIGRAMTHVQRLANHRGLMWLVVAWIGVMILTSIGFYATENGFNEAVQSPLDALWWGLVTMTTVGYGEIYPKTAEGRIAAAVLLVLGIALYSAIIATITSFLMDHGEAHPPGIPGQLERLARLHARGDLTEGEFAAAKRAVIEPQAGAQWPA